MNQLLIFLIFLGTSRCSKDFLFSRKSSFEKCEKCSSGPIQLSREFQIMKERVNTIYIEADKIYLNSFNSSSFIKFNHEKYSNYNCILSFDEIFDYKRLKWISNHVQKIQEFKNFQASWVFTISWMGIDNYKCHSSITFQIFLISNNYQYFIFYNFVDVSSFSNDLFTFGIKTKRFEKFIKTSFQELQNKSNIDNNGKWVFLVDQNNSNKIEFSLFFTTFYLIINFIF